jgi:predicted transcriptional regulator/DNA-binding XRE family transcriptional regulator
MASPQRLGAKVRALRRREGMTQSRLAEQLEISPSYLNLIEHNKRPLPATLLIRLAQLFGLDLQEFAAHDDMLLESDLFEVFGDPLFEPQGITDADVRDLVATHANVAQSVLGLYEAYQGERENAASLRERLAGEALDFSGGRPGMPSEEVSDLLQRNHNYFPELEEAAEDLWRSANLDLNSLSSGLQQVLTERHGVRVRFETARVMGRAVRRYDAEAKVLRISVVAVSLKNHFQLAHMVGILTHADLFAKMSDDERLTTPESRALAKVALANYYAGAVLMPYEPFLEAAREERYDIELLGHRFRVSYEQVCHRLCCMQRPSNSGVPLYLIRIDVAGNISKKFSANSMRFPRFAGLCPKGNVFQALLRQDAIRVQVSRMSESRVYFSIARTVTRGQRGYHATHTVHAIELGCELEYAKELVYSDGIDLEHLEAVVQVGVTCRLCRLATCEQRALPSIYAPLKVDPNVRAEAFYTRVDEDDE